MIVEQALEGDVLANLSTEHELDAHALHQLAARLDHFLLELEGRNSEREQSADLRVAVEHDRLDAIADQDVRAREARRPGADDRHALAGRHARATGPAASPP